MNKLLLLLFPPHLEILMLDVVSKATHYQTHGIWLRLEILDLYCLHFKDDMILIKKKKKKKRFEVSQTHELEAKISTTVTPHILAT